MNSYNPTVNTIRQYFRNVFSSGIFLAFTIATTVFTVFTTGEFLLSMLNAGMYGDKPEILNVVFPVLSIIGTVGLYCLRYASKNGDGERVVSSLNMTRCLSAIIIIINVVLYILSSLIIIAAILFMSIRSVFEELIDSVEFRDIITEFDGLDEIFGDLSIFVALTLLIVGLILLAIAILSTIYRKGISKTIRAAKNAETMTYAPFKISSFSIVFGYILGVIIALNGITSIYFDDPLIMLQGIFESLSYVSLGVTIFMLSLVMSRLKTQLSTVVYTPAYEKHCPSCGASVPFNSAFCMQCGASTNVQAPVAPAYAAPVQPSPVQPAPAQPTAAPEVKNDVSDEKAPDSDRPHSFCTNCGKPISPEQAFCANCGYKLK